MRHPRCFVAPVLHCVTNRVGDGSSASGIRRHEPQTKCSNSGAERRIRILPRLRKGSSHHTRNFHFWSICMITQCAIMPTTLHCSPQTPHERFFNVHQNCSINDRNDCSSISAMYTWLLMKCRVVGKPGIDWSWDVSQLRIAFKDCIQELVSQKCSLRVYIDALDEA